MEMNVIKRRMCELCLKEVEEKQKTGVSSQDMS